MRRSTDRILVSHAGNLPRPDYLNDLIAGGLAREQAQRQEYHERLPQAVQWVVERQIECGVDIVNDGEYVKAGSYGGYMQERLTGFASVPPDPSKPAKRAGVGERDRRDFPGFYASGLWLSGSGGPVRPGFATPGRRQRRSTSGSAPARCSMWRTTGSRKMSPIFRRRSRARTWKGISPRLAP